jgi:transaldolase
MTNPLVELGQLGQSIWYDFITRDLMASGALHRLIEQDGLSGMTSNPTIFEQAISSSSDYDADIRRLTTAGHGADDIFEALTVADVQAACDAFRPVYDATNGVDGLVSIEVSPTLAYDSDATLAEARRLWARVQRPNLMIKIPGTEPGLPAVEHAVADGINVNVTLLFSVARHREVIDAYLRGLEQRLAGGLPIDRIASVASFFVSRVDSKIDPLLDAAGAPEDVRSTAAIANACTAYDAFEAGFRGSRWDTLAEVGARVQRPLWASTSTKDPLLPDVYYVEALIASRTVNTLPPVTFEAYRDHGRPEVRLPAELAKAPDQLARLTDCGIDLDRATRELEDEGVQKFADSYRKAIASIDQKASLLVSAQ